MDSTETPPTGSLVDVAGLSLRDLLAAEGDQSPLGKAFDRVAKATEDGEQGLISAFNSAT